MSRQSLQTIFDITPPQDNFWDGAYKIPWNEPGFSARMLEIHLSQETDLASRKLETIKKQAKWLKDNALRDEVSRILDLGCGPGLYADHFARDRHIYRGIDFSPASIAHARKQTGFPALCEFSEGDVTTTDFGEGYDLAMMIYGELNVFSPDQCRDILARAHAALNTGGTLALELHTVDAVKAAGTAPASWHKADSGLFSPRPYICLQENHWNGEHAVAVQYFHVLDAANGSAATMRSTTKAWSDDELEALLSAAGFRDMRFREDWPKAGEHFRLLTAIK
ncbi:class I SAM-dependent methyltransferase [Salidesulfovibrio onnuriiensis]|uniref:class I SAM-dependent methyltransferase n=1 Tax=Salidesulfovibrio onnuriiensis TaxID=2583823 RepID=UPI0011CA9D5C|nr:class I SAM-dependent methyltransferase [Salidesulfovibrio onnuriiensis]